MTVSSPSSKYEYLPLEFTVSRALLEVAMTDSSGLSTLIAKVMCYSLVIFSLIAAFEAFVINGTRLICNVVILFINTINGIFFSNINQIPVELPPPLPLSAAKDTEPVEDEPLPLFSPEEETMFSDVFRILGTANVYELAKKNSFLTKSRDDTQHIHPLQVMGYMLQKNSKQREHCALFFNKAALRYFFIKDTLKGLKEPIHAAKTPQYIVSFAEQVDIEPDVVRRFLFQTPPLLQDLVLYILQH